MGFVDFFSKMNLATGGKNPNDVIFAGLSALGLKAERQDSTGAELAGMFRGREAAMVVDGSAVLGAAAAAMTVGAGTELAGAMGLISSSRGRWLTRRNDLRARGWMQRAQMMIRWAVVAAGEAPSALEIGKSPETGPAFGVGLYAAGAPTLVAALAHPQLLPLLQAAPFDAVLVDGRHVTGLWAPPMSEYQQVISTAEKVAQTTERVLTALSGVAYVICEGGR